MGLSSHNPLSSMEIAARLAWANEFGHPFLSYHESPEVVFMCHASAYLFKKSHFRSLLLSRVGMCVIALIIQIPCMVSSRVLFSWRTRLNTVLQPLCFVFFFKFETAITLFDWNAGLLINGFKRRLPQPMHLFSMRLCQTINPKVSKVVLLTRIEATPEEWQTLPTSLSRVGVWHPSNPCSPLNSALA